MGARVSVYLDIPSNKNRLLRRENKVTNFGLVVANIYELITNNNDWFKIKIAGKKLSLWCQGKIPNNNNIIIAKTDILSILM